MYRKFKHFIKRILNALAPHTAGRIVDVYRQRQFKRYYKRIGGVRITKEFITKCGTKVLAGPFAGMIYVEQSVGSLLLPKLVGSYECEIKNIVEEICTGDYDTIIDVGSAEGYYAVGFARRMSDVRIVAFESEVKGRKLCKKMAAINNIENRITQRGSCDPKI